MATYGVPDLGTYKRWLPNVFSTCNGNLYAAFLHDRPSRMEPPSPWLAVRVVAGERRLVEISCHLLLTPHCQYYALQGTG